MSVLDIHIIAGTLPIEMVPYKELGLVQWEVLREMVSKINRVLLKHRCLFLQDRRLIKRLSSTNKHRCLEKNCFISLNTYPKHLALPGLSVRSA